MSYDPHEAPCRAAFVGVVFSPAVGMGKATDGRDRLGDLTRQVFEPRAERRLTDEDVREIGENLVGFFGVLGEWARAERQTPSPPPGGEATTHDEASRARHQRRSRATRRSS